MGRGLQKLENMLRGSKILKRCGVLVVALLAMWGFTYITINVQSANAASFGLFEWGNRATGMGGAVIADPNPKPSAIAYNPAGMTKLEGTQTQAGATIIAPSADVTPAGSQTWKTKGKVYVIPHAYLTMQLNDDWWFGIGEFSRFGLGTNYDHDWTGSTNVYKASIQTISIQPTIAYKATDELSFALGLEVVHGKMDLRQNVQVVSEDIHMAPEGLAWTYVAAAHWTPDPKFNLGLTYRKGYVFKGRGEITINGVSPEEDQMTMTANFPGSLAFGLSVSPTDAWTFEFDIIETFWSSFEWMEYDFSDSTNAASLALTANNTTSHKKYKDSTRLQFGAEYEAWDNIFLRGGYVYDPSPQNSEYMDYMLPANNRQIVSTGLGVELGAFTLDFSYMYLWSQDYVIDNNVSGVVEPTKVENGVTHIGGLNFTYEF